jgi:glycosyltransferase involved in cell wall biosynthesis
MKLMILVQWYPPDIRVPARRWGNIVASLQKKGVICTVVSAGDGKYDEYKGENDERVLRLGISNQKKIDGHVKKVAFKRSLPGRIRRKILTKLLPPVFQNPSYNEWFKQKDTYSELIDIARNSDYIISSYGPMGPFVLGWWLSKKTARPWIADIRDSFESKETGKLSAWKRLQNRLTEKYLLKRAELRITIGATLADYLSKQYKVKFHAIYNGWVDEDRISDFSRTPDQSYIYYAGSFYEHQLPAMELLLDAVRIYPEINLKIRLLNDHTSGKVISIFKNAEDPNQVEVLPPVPSEIVKGELAGSICAIVIEDISDTDPLRNCTVTGKLLSLLASGIPGIAISSKSGEIRNLAGKIEGWHGVDSVEEFRDALREILSQGNSIKNIDSLSEYKMEEQSQKLLTLISGIEK